MALIRSYLLSSRFDFASHCVALFVVVGDDAFDVTFRPLFLVEIRQFQNFVQIGVAAVSKFDSFLFCAVTKQIRKSF